MAVVSAVSRRVVVIGAGPAGCAAAIAAREAGAEVLVLDRATFPRPKTCGDALSNEAVRLLRELMPAEVVDALHQHGHALGKAIRVCFDAMCGPVADAPAVIHEDVIESCRLHARVLHRLRHRQYLRRRAPIQATLALRAPC